MPFHALNGVTIPVRIDPVDAEVDTFGDEANAHDGTPLTRTRAQKRTWPINTKWMEAAQAATVRAQIVATPPAAATGDLTGAISVVAKLTGERTSTKAGGVRIFAYSYTVTEV